MDSLKAYKVTVFEDLSSLCHTIKIFYWFSSLDEKSASWNRPHSGCLFLKKNIIFGSWTPKPFLLTCEGLTESRFSALRDVKRASLFSFPFKVLMSFFLRNIFNLTTISKTPAFNNNHLIQILPRLLLENNFPTNKSILLVTYPTLLFAVMTI